mmetsp:Transcript_12316/g.17036  ORF Transcript_12316/g.17036 Transcript_12316/m.17036 type:complete len:772 (+) Transcript_12316:1461-3776(+)
MQDKHDNMEVDSPSTNIQPNQTENAQFALPTLSSIRKIELLEQRMGRPQAPPSSQVETTILVENSLLQKADHQRDPSLRSSNENLNLLATQTSPTMNSKQQKTDDYLGIWNSDSDELSAQSATSTTPTGPSTQSQTSQDKDKVKKKRKHYTQGEDTKILEGVKKYGADWDEIVKWGNFERTPTQIKERWRRLTKKEQADPGKQPNKYRKISDEVKATSPGSTVTPIVNDNASSNEDIVSKLVQMEKEKKELETENEKLKAREGKITEYEERLKKWEQELTQQALKEEQHELTKFEQMRKHLEQTLVKQAELEKEMARIKLSQECARLGMVTFERHGTGFVEVWQDGQVFRDFNRKHQMVVDEREHLEQLSKEIRKRIKKMAIAENTAQNMQLVDELLQQEEIYKIRVSNLKKEEIDLNAERDRLVSEKNRHIREMKRIHDEDQSRFNTHPVLKSRYVLLNLLGKGGFSEVYKAFDLQETMFVACKIHQLNTLWTDKKKENYIKHAVRECNIHKSVVHPKIVQLFDVFEIDDNSLCTVLEFCNGSDLDLHLKTNGCLSEREAKSIVTQIFGGLNYLSDLKRSVIHYDLKPANILFHNGEVKITDFGLSKIMEENQESLELTSQGAGTYWYLPPECFETGKDSPPKISQKVDVWSVGVIFYQMLYGKKPFGNNMSQQKILAENVIPNSLLDFPNKPVVSKEAKDFIRKCLTHSILQRPDVKTCYNDVYLKLPLPGRDKKESKKASKDSSNNNTTANNNTTTNSLANSFRLGLS